MEIRRSGYIIIIEENTCVLQTTTGVSFVCFLFAVGGGGWGVGVGGGGGGGVGVGGGGRQHIVSEQIYMMLICHHGSSCYTPCMHLIHQCRIHVLIHYDVIKWKHFFFLLALFEGNHRSAVDSPHKDQCRGALMFSLVAA